jgi:hypothetical protein
MGPVGARDGAWPRGRARARERDRERRQGNMNERPGTLESTAFYVYVMNERPGTLESTALS